MDQEHDSENFKFSAEEVKSISECAEVLRVRPLFLQRLVAHLQRIDHDMMYQSATPKDIDSIIINISSGGHWFSCSETKKPLKMPKGPRFKK